MVMSTFAQRLSFGLGLGAILVLLAILTNTAASAVIIAIGISSIVFAWRQPYLMLMLWAPLSMWVGWIVSIQTGQLSLGDAVVQLSTELNVAELIGFGLLAGWCLRLLFFWSGRRDQTWKPELPLLIPFVWMTVAELVSMLSPFEPPQGEVIKHALRYSVFLYLTCIVLVVNFLRSKRRFMMVLKVLGYQAVFFALGGMVTMFYFQGDLGFGRAMPLSLFGVNVLGGNQHSLAETLIIGLGALLAYGELTKEELEKRRIEKFIAFITVIIIATFSRTAWIVLAYGFSVLSVTIWRRWVIENARALFAAALAFTPVAYGMWLYSSSNMAIGSIDSRTMLTTIAIEGFKQSPWIGVGAGMYYQLVGSARAFLIEFGAPLDAHGIVQKIGAELGLFGLLALFFIAAGILRIVYPVLKRTSQDAPEYRILVHLSVLASGMALFQLFSTSYWTPRLWLPIGLLLAYTNIVKQRVEQKDPDFLLSHTL